MKSFSDSPPPILSVITVVRNGAATLPALFRSLERHHCQGVEHIVIDGQSGDGTVALLEHYSDRLAYWSSEPDQGIYDAMNKGVQRARGSWILFLGADDELSCDLSTLLPLLTDPATLYYGNSYWPHSGRTYDGPFTPSKLALTNICQQAILYPRHALLAHPFDPRYRLQADWAVNMACLADPALRFSYLPLTLSVFNDATGASSTQSDTVFEADYVRLLWRYFTWPVALWRSALCLGGRLLRKLGWKGTLPYTKRRPHE